MSKYAFVTGSSGGIGEAIAKVLADDGYIVGIHANKNAQKAEKIALETGGDFFVSDFSVLGEAEKLGKKILEKHDKIDLLVNAAGISKTGLFTDFTSADCAEIFNVNVISMMNLTRTILPSMIKRKYGNIINITSMWGEVGASCEVDYSATKGAVIAFTKALAKEVGPSGIRVNAVSPGVIKTNMLSCYSEETLAELADETPLGRTGVPFDIASAVKFLASHNSDFITGETLRVNGGFLI